MNPIAIVRRWFHAPAYVEAVIYSVAAAAVIAAVVAPFVWVP